MSSTSTTATGLIKSPRRRVPAPVKEVSTRRCIYEGRELWGSIEQQGSEFVAYGRRRQKLGVYPSAGAAIDAIATAVAGGLS